MELTTLARLKTYLGVATSDDDELLTMLLEATGVQVEQFCNRTFAVTAYVETLAAAAGYVAASYYPITAVSDPATATIDGTHIKGGFIMGKQYTVGYSAGYATIPADLELAIMILVAQQYSRRGSEHVKLEVTGPLRSEYIEGMPQQVKDILMMYRRPVI